MVQIFSVHQNSVGEFIFSDRVCSALITNRDILVDIPFATLSLQVVATIRNYLQVCHSPALCSTVSRCIAAEPRSLVQPLQRLQLPGAGGAHPVAGVSPGQRRHLAHAEWSHHPRLVIRSHHESSPRVTSHNYQR